MAKRKASLDANEPPPWRAAGAHWQRELGRRLETTRAEFRAETPPSGRSHATASPGLATWTVSLSPRDPLFRQRELLVLVPEGDARMRATEHYRFGEGWSMATGFRLERHSHMVLGRAVQVVILNRRSLHTYPHDFPWRRKGEMKGGERSVYV